MLRIVFDKNVPVGVRAFLARHDVRTFDETSWPRQLENGELLDKAESTGFCRRSSYRRSKHQALAKPHKPETRPGCARIEYLAHRAEL